MQAVDALLEGEMLDAGASTSASSVLVLGTGELTCMMGVMSVPIRGFFTLFKMSETFSCCSVVVLLYERIRCGALYAL